MPKGNKPGEPPKYRNVTIDADLVELMNREADELEPIFGFRPTLSQTIRHVIKREIK
jgi:hypothetical protein